MRLVVFCAGVFALCSSGLLAAQVASAPSPEFQKTQYWQCVHRRAEKLERSGERPRDVAVAALEACREAEQQWATERGYGPNFMRIIRAHLMDKIIAQVVEIRAKRRR